MAIEKCINEYATGEVIFEEGSTGRELFVVLDGKVDIAKTDTAKTDTAKTDAAKTDAAKTDGTSRTVIVSLGKGEFFGEMAVIDGSARSASAIAATPGTRVMRINHARFVYLVSQQPAFALMVMDALSKRLRASNLRNFGSAASS
jgi:CRP-like cAMP-binding protein